jgi:hypothetical protein
MSAKVGTDPSTIMANMSTGNETEKPIIDTEGVEVQNSTD